MGNGPVKRVKVEESIRHIWVKSENKSAIMRGVSFYTECVYTRKGYYFIPKACHLTRKFCHFTRKILLREIRLRIWSYKTGLGTHQPVVLLMTGHRQYSIAVSVCRLPRLLSIYCLLTVYNW